MIGALILGLVAGFIGRALVPNDVFSEMSGPTSWAVSVVLGPGEREVAPDGDGARAVRLVKGQLVEQRLEPAFRRGQVGDAQRDVVEHGCILANRAGRPGGRPGRPPCGRWVRRAGPCCRRPRGARRGRRSGARGPRR